jgi:hypothetical protein
MTGKAQHLPGRVTPATEGEDRNIWLSRLQEGIWGGHNPGEAFPVRMWPRATAGALQLCLIAHAADPWRVLRFERLCSRNNARAKRRAVSFGSHSPLSHRIAVVRVTPSSRPSSDQERPSSDRMDAISFDMAT